MRLTIAIPTYNRNALLLESLRLLLPQLTRACELLILDNASPSSVEESAAPLILGYSQVQARIIRNRVNIGGAANFLRCFEHCQTEWMWLLGDDDEMEASAVATILGHIEAHPHAVYLNFSSPCMRRQETFETRGLDDFVERMDSFSNVLFMSAGVYRVPQLIPALRLGYVYSYSWAPHLALLLGGLGRDGHCVFSSASVIGVHCRATVQNMWSPIGPLLGKMTLLDLPLSGVARRALAIKMRGDPSLEFLTMQLVFMDRDQARDFEPLYAYDQICHRLYYFENTLSLRLRVFAYRILIKYPRIGRLVIQRFYSSLGWLPVLRRNPLNKLVVVDPSL